MDMGVVLRDRGSAHPRRVKHACRRGVTLVEVLIVIALMAIITGMATLFVIPQFKKARIRAAALGADAVREAAVLHRDVEAAGDPESCPTVQDLLAARTLEARRSKDPWGTRFNVDCEDAIHGSSSGSDRQRGTADDVRDDITSQDVDRLAGM